MNTFTPCRCQKRCRQDRHNAVPVFSNFESSIFKAVSEKERKQGMYCRRRIYRPRFTFELRPLLEPFWTSRCQQICLRFLWVRTVTNVYVFCGYGSDVWSVFLDSFLNLNLLKMHFKIMHSIFQLVNFPWCHDV